MSVSLLEVIEAGGYNLNTTEDANWLLATQNEYEQLIEQAEELVEKIEDQEYEERIKQEEEDFKKESENE